MSWGDDSSDRDRDWFDQWATDDGRDAPARRPNGTDPWGGDPAPERLRPLTLGEVLDGAFRLLRQHWRAFALGLGVVVVPLALVSGFALAQVFGSVPGVFESLQDPTAASGVAAEPDFAQLTRALVGGGLAGLVGVLLTPLIYGIAVRIAATGYRTGAVDAMAEVRATAARYLPLLAAVIMMGLVPLVIFVLPGVVLVGGAVSGVDALRVVGGLAFIASFVVAVIAVARLVLTVPAVVLEDAGPVRALGRSNALVKGRTGFVLGTVVVVYIVTAIVQAVLGLPFQFVGGALGTAGSAVLATAGSIVTNLVGNSLIGSALALLYFDRRVRAEGYDLTEMAGELGEPDNHGW